MSAHPAPGVSLDVDASMVTIAGTPMPAVAVVCPPYDGDPDPPSERMLGGPDIYGGTEVWLPLESGLLVILDIERSGSIRVALEYHRCTVLAFPHDPLWLPARASFAGGRVQVHDGDWPLRYVGTGMWHDAEADWIAEHVARLGRAPLDVAPGVADAPSVELVPLRRAWDDFAERLERVG